jgi:hypothetical protein
MTNINSNINNEIPSNTGSVILNLEKISKEYNNVLTQYNQARSNYINYLSTQNNQTDASGSNSDVSDNQQYFTLPNTFYGQNSLTNVQTNNIASCKNQCSANTSCTGANFLKGSTCLLMKDVNGVLSAYQNSNAIVPPEIYYLNTLKQLNQQLIKINNQLTEEINKGQPIYDKQVEERQLQGQILDTNYKKLMKERAKIELQLKEFDDINEAQQNSTLIVNKNYTIYKYLFFIFIIIVLIMMVMPSNVSNQITTQIGGKVSHDKNAYLFNGPFIFIFIFIFIMILLYYKFYV